MPKKVSSATGWLRESL